MNLDLMTGGDLSTLKQRLSEMPTTQNSPNAFSVSITRPPKPTTNPPIETSTEGLTTGAHPKSQAPKDGDTKHQTTPQPPNTVTPEQMATLTALAGRIETAASRMEASAIDLARLMNDLPENVQEILQNRLAQEVSSLDQLMGDVRRRHMKGAELEVETLRVALHRARAELDEKPRRAALQTFLMVINAVALIGVLAAVIILILTQGGS